MEPDGIIDAYDRNFYRQLTCLNSLIRSITLFSYKNFDAEHFPAGSSGNKIFNAERVIVEGMSGCLTQATGAGCMDTRTSKYGITRAISGDPNGNSVFQHAGSRMDLI